MTMHHSFLSASWPTTCFVAWKSIAKVPNHKIARRPNVFLSFFFFFFFRRASSKLHDSFIMVSTQNSNILHRATHQPIAFQVPRGNSKWSLKNYGFICDTIFQKHVRCAQITQQLLFKIAELKIRLCAWRQGKSLASIVHSMFEPGQWFFSQYWIHLLWGSLWR